MWTASSLEDLKNQAIKAKTYKAKLRDVQTYAIVFEKYFTQFRHAANCNKVIEYFLEVFTSTLHLNPNQKIFQCFKKLIHWLNLDPNSKGAYYLVKNVVELCEREFPLAKLESNEQLNGSKKLDGERQKKIRDKSKDRGSNSRQRSMENQKRQNESEINGEVLRANLKTVLILVRKAGDKNMLIQDVYQTFIEYYLERLSVQMQEISKQQNKTSIKFGSHILKQLSGILANRNKSQVVPVVRAHIQRSNSSKLSSFIGIYFLLELKNIPHLLSPVLTSKTQIGINNEDLALVYPRQIEQSIQKYFKDGDTSILMSEFISLLQDLLASLLLNKEFELIPFLYKLYPTPPKQELRNSENLLDRFFIYSVLQGFQPSKFKSSLVPNFSRWRKEFIDHHSQYIESTTFQSNNKILGINYVFKLYIFSAYLLKFGLKRPDISNLIDYLVTGVERQMKISIEKSGWISQIYKMVEDCISAVGGYESEQKDLYQKEDKVAKFYKFKSNCKEAIKQFINVSNSLDTENVKAKLNNFLAQSESFDSLMENWKVVLQCIFQLCLQKPKKAEQKSLFDQYYNQESLFALKQFCILPSLLLKPQPLLIQFHSSKLSECCVQILLMVVQLIQKEQTVGYIKKLMSQAFQRVDQQVIRDIIVKDLFLCRCLLMTAHIPKCKFMMQLFIRYYQCDGLNANQTNKQNIFNYLHKMLPTIPKPILLDYCRYISNRDKLQFKMCLFQNQLTQYEYLLEANFYDIATSAAKKHQLNGKGTQMKE